MEVAGIALGALVLIKPICVSIHDTWSAHQGFGKDASQIRLRFSVQQTRLDSFERVLFEENKFAPAMPGRLIDHLPKKIAEDLVDLLGQLYAVLFEYNTSIKTRFDIEDRGEVGRAGKVSTMTSTQRADMLVVDGARGDNVQQRSANWGRKVMWVIWGKRSTEKMVVEFEMWADRMKELLEAAWWPLPFFETVANMHQLEQDGDAKEAGLLHGIGIRKLLVVSPIQAIAPPARKNLEISRVYFGRVSSFGNYDIGKLREDPSNLYLVEYKPYELGALGVVSEVVRRRITQLAFLLNEAAETDDRFRVLKCEHYFNDLASRRFGFVYSLPPMTPDTTTQPFVKSLSDLLSSLSRDLRPSLEARLRLAYNISLSVSLLHSYGWVHKSLRSEIIIFFPPTGASILSELRITGFEYARLETDFSSAHPEIEIGRNLYRHPARWGEPGERFTKVHDIYALGVLLLEIGLWERVDLLDKGALLKPGIASANVKDKLLKHASRRLEFLIGERYRDIVVGCLSGEWAGNEHNIAEELPNIVKNLEGISKGL